jgi:peroxiredoxin
MKTMKTTMKRVGIAAFCLAIGALGMAGYLSKAPVTDNAPAPQVAYTLLDGTPAHTAALQGKVVMVNFWATTCAVCVQEMPQLVATHKLFEARGLHTLAVAMSYDPPAFVVDFAQRKKLPFPVVIDNTGAVARAYGDVRGTPTTLLINKQGRIVKRYVGAPDFTELQRRLDGLLKES